jgi:long-chain fatty acid transport protein
MIKRIFTLATLLFCLSVTTNAGGLMTNTNYHIAFDRMFARGASTEIDAAYSNPAGLAWGYDGFQMSIDFQKPWQNRDIETPSAKYNGKASAPIVPALFASYKKDRWALSSMIGIVGSGGFVKYDNGVPMFNEKLAGLLSANGITPEQYKLDSKMKGKQYIYGGQLNFTYRITDFLSAAVGVRANYYDGYYQGHVIADQHRMFGSLASLELDVDQRAWGFAPIVSLDFHQGPITVAARYEFRTKINTENSTNKLDASIGTNLMAYLAANSPAVLQTIASTLGNETTPYEDGAMTRYDMPALLAIAAGYEISPKLRAALEYHFFDDKNAKMAGNRQNDLTGGTHEILAGIEYDINDKFTVSCGGQRTDYGLSDEYQKDTSFACDSYSVGLGGAWNINDKMRLNVSYFCTIYSDYTKQPTTTSPQEIYSRTNNVIGVGVDYKF